ncbi:MAG: hypothetical protein AAF927_03815 [Bacteroidota bacterium]
MDSTIYNISVGNVEFPFLDSRQNPISVDIPILLFPIRLEIRYSIDETELLIRFFPDDIITEEHDPRLSNEEILAYKIYARATDKQERHKVWRDLVTRFGVNRSKWIVIFGKQALASASIDDKNEHLKYSRMLPDKFIAQLYTDDHSYEEYAGAEIRKEEIVRYASANGPESIYGLNILSKAPIEIAKTKDWMFNFNLAVEIGMGMRIKLGDQKEFKKLLAFGIKNSWTPHQTKRNVEELIQSHDFTSGFSFLPYGTPTNNTSESDSGYKPSERWETEKSFKLDSNSVLSDSSQEGKSSFRSRGNGENLSRLLGIDFTTFQHIESAGLKENSFGRYAQEISWNIFGGYMLDIILNKEYTDKVKFEVWEYFCDYVSAKGPFSSIRVQEQPYGILPIMSLKGATQNFDSIEGKLAKILLGIKTKWQKVFEEADSETQIPRLRLDALNQSSQSIEEQVSAVLAMSPTSRSLTFTPVNDGGGETLKTYAIFAGQNKTVSTQDNQEAGINRVKDVYKKFVDKKFSSVKKTSELIKDILYQYQSGITINEERLDPLTKFLDIQSPESLFLELFPYGKPLDEIKKKTRKEQNQIVNFLKTDLKKPSILVDKLFKADGGRALEAAFESDEFKNLWKTQDNQMPLHLITEVINRSLKYLGRFFKLNTIAFPSNFPPASYEPDAGIKKYQYILTDIHVKKGQYVKKDEILLSVLILETKSRISVDIENAFQDLVGSSPAYVAWKTDKNLRLSENTSLPKSKFPIASDNGYLLRKFGKDLPNTRSVHQLEIRAKQKGIIDDIMVEPLEAITRGKSLLTFRSAIDQSLDRYAEAYSSLAKIIVAPEKESLDHLEHFEQGIRECLDLSTYRIDAWITALATSHLDKEIRRNRNKTGLYVGCYGYLENLNPNYGKAGEGEFIHAPTIEQAQNLAIIRQAYNNESLPNNIFQEGENTVSLGNPASVYLTSERVQLAKKINEGLKHGISSGAVLGEIFREEMFRVSKRKEYLEFSRRYPLLASKSITSEEGVEPTEEETAIFDLENFQTVDGLKLIDDEVFTYETSQKSSNDKVIVDIIRKLRSCYDGKFDLDGMEYRHHSLINRNLEQAASVAQAFEGKKGIDNYESISTKRSGIKHTYRFINVFPGELNQSFQNPKAIAEPRLESWLKEQIGPLENIEFGVVCHFKKDQDLSEPIELSREFLSLKNLEFGYLDLLGVCKQNVSVPEEESMIHLRASMFLYNTEELPIKEEENGQYVFLLKPDQTSTTEKKKLSIVLKKLRVIKDYLAKTSPVLPQQLIHTALVNEKLFTLSTEDIITQYGKLQQAFRRLNELINYFSTDQNSQTLLKAIFAASSFGIPEAQFYPEIGHKTQIKDRIENSLKKRKRNFTTYREGLFKKYPFLERNEIKGINLEPYENAFKDISSGFSILFSQSQKTASKKEASSHPTPPFPISYEITPPTRFLEINQKDTRYTLKGNADEANERIINWVQQKSEISASMAAFELYEMQTVLNKSFKVLQYNLKRQENSTGEVREFELVSFPWMSLSDEEIKETIGQSNIYSQAEKDRIVQGKKVQRPRGAFSLITYQDQTLSINEGKFMAARSLLMDTNDAEFIPNNEVKTGVSLYKNSPNSEAPQSILLAVPHKGQKTWSNKNLSSLLMETFDLAKIRLVDQKAINAADIYLPATFFPINTDYDQKEPSRSPLTSRKMGPNVFNSIISKNNSVFSLNEQVGESPIQLKPLNSYLSDNIILENFRGFIKSDNEIELGIKKILFQRLKTYIDKQKEVDLEKVLKFMKDELKIKEPLNLLAVPMLSQFLKNLYQSDIRINSNQIIKRVSDNKNKLVYAGLKLKKINLLNTYGIFFENEGITIELLQKKTKEVPLEHIMLRDTNRTFRFKMGVEKSSYKVEGLDIFTNSIYSKTIEKTGDKMVTIEISHPKLKYIRITGSRSLINKNNEAYILPQSLV